MKRSASIKTKRSPALPAPPAQGQRPRSVAVGRALRLSVGLIYLLTTVLPGRSPGAAARWRVAVLDFGETETGSQIAEAVSRALGASPALLLLDRALGRAAARGAAYRGSLNLTLTEARALGSSIGADFYLIGDARVLRRSSSARPVYFEAYLSVFVVSTRSGRLLLWDHVSVEGAESGIVERGLREKIGERVPRYLEAIMEVGTNEPVERMAEMSRQLVLLAEVPEEDDPAAKEFRPPQPYRRLRPAYPETAARAEAAGTVDVAVEIGADGEPGRLEILRWAGFGLDEEVLRTVRQMHFRPAMRAGTPVAVRALLRYNFRPPPPTSNEPD